MVKPAARWLLWFGLVLSSLSQADMKLKLEHPPTPEYAARHAATAVAMVKKMEGVDLDYSPESLKAVDKIIQRFHAEGVTEDEAPTTIFLFGCYAGEVFVRNRGAKWVDPDSVLPADTAQFFPFMVVQLPNGQIWSPIGKAFEELENGAEDSLEFLYVP